jgi:hypothetical protein
MIDQWSIKSPEPAAVGAGCYRATGSAVASVKPRGATPLYGVPAASRRRLSFFRWAATRFYEDYIHHSAIGFTTLRL